MTKQYASLELKRLTTVFRITRIDEDGKILSDATFYDLISLVRIDAPVSSLFAAEIDILNIHGTLYLFGSDAQQIAEHGYIESRTIKGERLTVEHTPVPTEKAYEILLENMAALSLLLLKKLWGANDNMTAAEDTEVVLIVPAYTPNEFDLKRFFRNNIFLEKIDRYDATIYTSFIGEWMTAPFAVQSAMGRSFLKYGNTLFVRFDALSVTTFTTVVTAGQSDGEQIRRLYDMSTVFGFSYDASLLHRVIKKMGNLSTEEATDLYIKILNQALYGTAEEMTEKEQDITKRSLDALGSHFADKIRDVYAKSDVTADSIVLLGDFHHYVSSEDIGKIASVVFGEEVDAATDSRIIIVDKHSIANSNTFGATTISILKYANKLVSLPV